MWHLLRCACSRPANCPILKADIWEQIERKSMSFVACFECAERHLGRPLVSDDLERCSENEAFICMMGRWGGSFNQKPDWAERLERRIMKQLDDLKAALDGIDTTVQGMAPEVTKISSETSALIQQIADLKASAGDVLSDDDKAKLDGLVTKAQAIQTAAANVASGIQAVDDLVPDVTAPAAAPSGDLNPNANKGG